MIDFRKFIPMVLIVAALIAFWLWAARQVGVL